jgi:succinoglycan biosynthesis transport protein ExoP
MQYLSSGPEGELNHRLVRAENFLLPDTPRHAYPVADEAAEESSPLQIGRLLRKYWLLLLGLMILGSAGGFVSVILSSPMYRSQLMLEIQSSSGLLRQGENSSAESSDIDIQTQVQILRSGSFLKRGFERMQTDSAPLAPTGPDVFSRLRQRIRPATQNPLEASKTGLLVAMANFDARPISRTRLIELTTQSTSPDVAAQFLNVMSQIFKEDSTQSRSTTAQATGVWLAQQIDDAKARVKAAEEGLQEFSQANGNIFAGQDATLDDTKLTQLKAELAKIQPELIARQNRYNLTLKYPPEQLGEVLDDGVLRSYQQQIETLKREKAMLLTTLTEKHEKVRKVDAQLEELGKAYSAEISSVLTRIKHDYEATVKQRDALNSAYAGQSQRVGSEAGKVAQWNALKREADTERQTYQNLLIQQNQNGLSSSVPVSPVRIIEEAAPAETPYKPQPVLNISFGTVLGVALAAGLIFLRERLDRSIKVPGMSRRMFNAPELGVIPNLGNGNGAKRGWLGGPKNGNGTHEDPSTAVVAPAGAPTFVTESFRSTLASILRNQASGRPQKIILVTSPGPSEGKTTVVQNLGIVLAESGRKVLLVDADFRRPHLHRKFGLGNEWGLIDLLCEELPLSEYPLEKLAVPTGLPGLAILPNRVTQNNVAKALYSPRFRTVVDNLSEHYDMILVDAPPILSVADARIIAPLADSLILVLRCGVTNRESAMEAYQRIQADGVPLLGTVLTDYDLSADRRRQYYYDYGDTSRV